MSRDNEMQKGTQNDSAGTKQRRDTSRARALLRRDVPAVPLSLGTSDRDTSCRDRDIAPEGQHPHPCSNRGDKSDKERMLADPRFASWAAGL